MVQRTGGPGADSLNGSNVADSLFGAGGDDTLVAGAGTGVDTLDGSEGSDSLVGATASKTDTASYASATGSVAVDLAAGRGFDTDGLGEDTLVSIESLVGTRFGDALFGDGNDNTIDGGLGNDSLDGRGGRDTLAFTSGFDVRVDLHITSAQDTGEGQDTIVGFENLIGGAGDDTLIGDETANVIRGGAGADVLAGGGGNDTIFADENDTSIGYGANGAGADSITGGTVDYSGFDSVKIQLQHQKNNGADGDTLTTAVFGIIGTDGDDDINGNGRNNVFIAGDGADSLWGNSGNDTIHGGLGHDTLWGDVGNDSLLGGSDWDTIYADRGDDTIDGGDGVDTLIVNKVGVADVAIHLDRAGSQDTRGYGVDRISGIENVVGGTARDQITGDDGANLLRGMASSDQLYGRGGDDTLTGDDSNDTLSGGDDDDSLDGGGQSDMADYSSAGASVTVDLARTDAQDTGGAGVDMLKNFEGLIGSAFADFLYGTDMADTLAGGGGDDHFFGRGGADTVQFTTGHAVTVDLGDLGPQNTGDGLDVFDSIENLIGGKGNDHLVGDGQNNALIGGGGIDTLEGGSGNDTLDAGGDKRDVMFGGLGDDVLRNGRASYDDIAGPVTIDLQITGAQDTGSAGMDSFVNVTSVIGTGQADVIKGDFFNNGLTGGGGADSLSGDVGADVLVGAAGNDTLDGGAGSDRLAGGAGDDLLIGGQGKDTASYAGIGARVVVNLNLAGAQNTVSAGFDTLQSIENVLGSRFNDLFFGTTGDNVFTGGGGSDRMTGGGGADVFVYDAVTDSTAAAADYIHDLAADDNLDLELVDADVKTAGDQAFHVVAAFTRHAAEIALHYDAAKNLSSLKADVDGDGSVDMLMNFDGDVTGLSGGWLL